MARYGREWRSEAGTWRRQRPRRWSARRRAGEDFGRAEPARRGAERPPAMGRELYGLGFEPGYAPGYGYEHHAYGPEFRERRDRAGRRHAPPPRRPRTVRRYGIEDAGYEAYLPADDYGHGPYAGGAYADEYAGRGYAGGPYADVYAGRGYAGEAGYAYGPYAYAADFGDYDEEYAEEFEAYAGEYEAFPRAALPRAARGYGAELEYGPEYDEWAAEPGAYGEEYGREPGDRSWRREGSPHHRYGSAPSDRWPEEMTYRPMAVRERRYDDGEIRDNVYESLFQDMWVDARNVRVDVRDGVVTLSGEVPDFIEARYAWDDAWETPGVRGVINNLTVRADLPREFSPLPQVRHRYRAAGR